MEILKLTSYNDEEYKNLPQNREWGRFFIEVYNYKRTKINRILIFFAATISKDTEIHCTFKLFITEIMVFIKKEENF